MNLERLVVARGAATSLLLAAPAALANVILADQEPKPKAALNLTLLVILVGFVLGGVLAGHEATHDRTRHGAMAALVGFVPVQVIGILGRLDRGAGLAPLQIVFLGLLAAAAGTVGASIGSSIGSRRRPSPPPQPTHR